MSAPNLFTPSIGEPRPMRPHQIAAMDMLRRSIGEGNRRVVLQMPTGAGKTRTAAEIVNGALAKGKRVCFTVPRISLIDQTVAAFAQEGIEDVGVIQANHWMNRSWEPVQIASVQTLARRELPEADLVIVDECHEQSEVINAWLARDPDKTFIGLSATPWARGMADHWQELITPVRMQELIDAGYLSPFKVFAPSHPDLTGVGTVAGDYQQDQLGLAMSDNRLVADIVETWRSRGEWRPTLVFAVNRAHAAKLQAEFAAAGVFMGYCDAFVDLVERKLLFERMAAGAIQGIVNVGTLTTGVDADVRCIVLARPTKSEMLFVQMIGRGLRTADLKDDCLILDHADNHARLGFVTDIHHPALLDGKAKRAATRKEKGEPMPKECGGCGTLKPPKTQECPSCGFVSTRQSDIEPDAGQLVELSKKVDRIDKQRIYSELLAVAKMRGRSPGWVANCYRERTKVWPRGLTDEPIEPSPETLSWVRAKDIRWAKRRQA